MSEVVRFETGTGSPVLVEVEDDAFGVERVSRAADGVKNAGRVLTEALDGVRDAAETALSVLRQSSPDSVEMEFGVKLAGEAGAIIAKTAAEGHFTVKLSWSSTPPPVAP